MDQPLGFGGDANPSATNNAGAVRFRQTRREDFSGTGARSRRFHPLPSEYLRVPRIRENSNRTLDFMEIDHESEIPNSGRGHDQAVVYAEGIPHRVAQDQVAGSESPELWDAFRGERPEWDSTDEESTEEVPHVSRSHWQSGPNHSRRVGPPTNPLRMEYRNGVPGPHSRVHAEAHQVTPYGTPAHRPTLDTAAQRPIQARSVADVMGREFPDSGSSINTPRTTRRMPPSFPPPPLPRLGTAVRPNRHSAQTHGTGTSHTAPETSPTHSAFEQFLRTHRESPITDQAISNPLNSQYLARNLYHETTWRAEVPAEGSIAERNTATSGPSHTGLPPRNSRNTAEIIQAIADNRASGMTLDRALVLEALARERAGDTSGSRTTRLPRSPGLDRDDGRPPPKSEEEMMMSVECKICYGQPISVAFMPCGHYVMCQWCANQAVPSYPNDFERPLINAQCPMCRRLITKKIKIYLS